MLKTLEITIRLGTMRVCACALNKVCTGRGPGGGWALTRERHKDHTDTFRSSERQRRSHLRD
jgi:hypothetical protein